MTEGNLLRCSDCYFALEEPEGFGQHLPLAFYVELEACSGACHLANLDTQGMVSCISDIWCIPVVPHRTRSDFVRTVLNVIVSMSEHDTNLYAPCTAATTS